MHLWHTTHSGDEGGGAQLIYPEEVLRSSWNYTSRSLILGAIAFCCSSSNISESWFPFTEPFIALLSPLYEFFFLFLKWTILKIFTEFFLQYCFCLFYVLCFWPWGMWDLSYPTRDGTGLPCGMWDLVPWPGIQPRPPSLGAQSLSHWTTRKAP